MALPVVGSKIKLTGTVEDYCPMTGMFKVNLVGNSKVVVKHIVVFTEEMVNAEVISAPLHVGDKVMSLGLVEYEILAIRGDMAALKPAPPRPGSFASMKRSEVAA